MLQDPISRTRRYTLGALSIILLLLSYSWLSHTKHVENPDDRTIPSFAQLRDGIREITTVPEPEVNLLAAALGEDIEAEPQSSMLARDLKATGLRFFYGYGLSVICGVILGTLMGSFLSLEALTILPLRLASRIIPTAALAVFFVLAGTNMSMYVAMIVFGTLPAISIGIAREIADFPTELRYKAYTLGASHFEVVWDVFLPIKAPQIIEIIKSNIGPAMVYLLAAELLVANQGFGYTIRIFSRKLDMAVVYPYLLILAFFGFVFDILLKATKEKACPWHTKQK